MLNRICGDGVLDSGEECDDGNVRRWRRLSGRLQELPICGDGIRRRRTNSVTTETTSDGDGCQADCRLNPICGDGILDDRRRVR